MVNWRHGLERLRFSQSQPSWDMPKIYRPPNYSISAPIDTCGLEGKKLYFDSQSNWERVTSITCRDHNQWRAQHRGHYRKTTACAAYTMPLQTAAYQECHYCQKHLYDMSQYVQESGHNIPQNQPYTVVVAVTQESQDQTYWYQPQDKGHCDSRGQPKKAVL